MLMKTKNIILKRINRTAFKKSIKGNPRDIADLLCDIVNTSSMDLKEIADICGLSPQTVKRIIENEKPYTPNTETLKKICEGFDFHLEIK